MQTKAFRKGDDHVMRSQHRGLGIRLGLVSMMLLMAGCAVGPNFKSPQSPVGGKWTSADEQKIKGTPADTREWWKVFNDPVLNSLVDQAFQQNPSLQAAGLRIIQSRLARAVSVWTFFPMGSVSGSAMHKHNSTNVKPEVTIGKGGVAFSHQLGQNLSEALGKNVSITLPDVSVSPKMDIYSAGVDAIWELDVWGKIRRNVESQTAQLHASIADYDSVLVSLTGEVALSYIEIRTLQQRLKTAQQNIAVLKNALEIAQGRAHEGEVTRLDENLAMTLLRNTQASVPLLEAALAQAENGLCILLGKQPYDIGKELGEASGIPVPPPSVAVGAPADLLRRRPDVRMAEYQAAADCARIGAAKAGVYPSFSLFGGLGLSSSKSNMFFKDDSVGGNYGGLFSWNILLYPAIQDAVRLRDAQFQESVLNYKNTVLTAAQEVESAATAFVKTQDRLPLLADSVEASRQAVELATGQYKRGTVDFSTVTDSLAYLVQGNDSLVEAKGQTAMALVATYKALGGGWEIRQGKEVVPEEIKNQMKKETEWWTIDGPTMLNTKKLMDPLPMDQMHN